MNFNLNLDKLTRRRDVREALPARPQGAGRGGGRGHGSDHEGLLLAADVDLVLEARDEGLTVNSMIRQTLNG
jgi:hypothetical protein